MREGLVGWTFEALTPGPYDPLWRGASWDGRRWVSEPVDVVPSTELVLSWNAVTPPGSGIAFEVSLRIGGECSNWTPMGNWGDVPPVRPVDSPIKRDVDTATWEGVADAVRVRVHAFGDGERLPHLKRIVVSCRGQVEATSRQGPPQPGPFVCHVPFRSQMTEGPELAKRMCGPTSLAMHLATVEPNLPTAQVASAAYDRAHDLYGNWPHLAAVAGERGFVSWVQQFSFLREVEERLLVGYGAILSVAFEEGQLDGAPIPRTNGHLLVLRGWDDEGNPVCNDPAFPDERGDGVRYRRDQLEGVWSRHGGATILLRPE